MSDAGSRARSYLAQTTDAVQNIDPEAVAAVLELLEAAWRKDRQVFFCGNGGSAALASHMAADMARQTMLSGHSTLRTTALTDNVAAITAWANDSDFSRVFAEQLAAHGRPDDLLVCISASGNSENIVEAIAEAQRIGIGVVGLGGFDGGLLRRGSDAYVHVPSFDYGEVESAHLVVHHCLTTMLREAVVRASVEDLADTGKALVIVDRDGVINENRDDHVLSWDDFTFIPGVLEALAILSNHGHRVVVVSNQGAVGRGQLTLAQLNNIHRRMEEEVQRAGGRIAGVYFCPHAPGEGCACRKPAPGMLQRAAVDLGFDLERAYFIGDHVTDIEAARAAGASSVLVLSGRQKVVPRDPAPDRVYDDLLEAAWGIVREDAGRPRLALTVDSEQEVM